MTSIKDIIARAIEEDTHDAAKGARSECTATIHKMVAAAGGSTIALRWADLPTGTTSFVLVARDSMFLLTPDPERFFDTDGLKWWGAIVELFAAVTASRSELETCVRDVGPALRMAKSLSQYTRDPKAYADMVRRAMMAQA